MSAWDGWTPETPAEEAVADLRALADAMDSGHDRDRARRVREAADAVEREVEALRREAST